jgi:hypothetical protein
MMFSNDSQSQEADERLAEEYAHLSADELLNLRGESASLTRDAREILKKELTRRGLDQEPLKSGPNPSLLQVRNSDGTMTALSGLDEWPTYSGLVRRKMFMQKYYRPLALVPFGIVLFTGGRFFGDSTSRFAIVPVYLSLIWALLVLVYTFWLVIRVRAIRCPRCGDRFGSEDECIPCGFPRHAAQVHEQHS